jgi:putative MATE family efflux protein
MPTLLFADKEFFPTLLRLAAPIALQNLIIFSMGMVDIIMIGQLGETPVAAIGLAEQPFFLFVLLLFGISSGAAIFTAQFWGRKDIRRIRSVLGICLLLSLAASLVFTLVAIIIPDQVLSLYSTDAAVVKLGSRYLRIVGLSYVATAITYGYSAVLRSMESARLPLITSLISLSFSTGLSYGLIFGRFGLPQLGVTGAALAICLARYLECILLLSIIYSRKLPVAATIREMLDLKAISLGQFFKTTGPVILTEMAWSLGITTYHAVYARIGTEAIAAVNIAVTIDRVLFVAFLAMGNACAIMIGNRIGAGELARAEAHAKRFLILGPIGAVIIGLVVLASADTILSLYQVSDLTLTYAHNILRVMALTLTIRVLNLLLLIGILRSGGDTRFALAVDALIIWGVGVPLAFIGAFFLHLPVYGVFLLVMTEEVIKLGLGLWRFFTGKWIHDLVEPALSQSAPSELSSS